MISDAVLLDYVARVVGYKIKKGNYAASGSNLPQRIAIFAEANAANQTALTSDPVEITSAKAAGVNWGYGSPIHQIMRILRPLSGDGVGGIPTVVYPQPEEGGASAKIMTVTPVGVATKSGTHLLIVNGRNSVDGVPYSINIESGDDVADITQKIEDAVNGVLSSPFSASSTDYLATLTTKWKGLTANGSSITVDTGDVDLGISYNIATTQAGAGTPSVASALSKIGNDWVTIVVNSYGTVSTVMDALEEFNGIPNPDVPTGRFAGIVWKPFRAITGSVADDPSSITDARELDVTICIAPAPGSAGLALEAAANMTYLHAIVSQNNPHLDVSGMYYPDMPVPVSIGSMAEYVNRNLFVKKGCSTIDKVAGNYQVQDFISTYHPDGEVPPQYRYARNLNLDANVRYTYKLLEEINVVDHAIANNSDVVTVSKVIRPKQWIQILNSMALDLTSRGLIVDPDFLTDSIQVGISTTNPDRFETSFRYKRSGFVRQASTDAEAGFNFGTL